ncbi:1-aminocyclopropane-1-carboxylate deaminase [Geopyxis carbonaria]|nr:1-aminocyclopropane-1-carboxylate deaminase [Geopyxis carbonaria]
MDTAATAVTITLPEPFASIPRHPLLFGPSPLQPLPRLAAALLPPNSTTTITAKREDANSGIAFGGNKVRKLEYLAADALASGATHLVSIGGVQSNHTRAVAGVAAALGLQAVLVQEHWVPSDDTPAYSRVGNLQLSRLLGAAVSVVPGTHFGIAHKPTVAAAMDDVRAGGGAPYYIPAGASDHALGGLGFARWAFEVAAQEKARGVHYGVVVVCVVTGSTMAGMVAGFRALELAGGRKRRVVGIDASADVEATRRQTLRIARDTMERIGGRREDVREEDVVVDGRFHAGVYGVPDEATMEAMRVGARTEGMITDPVYEGKSLAGLMYMLRHGEIAEGENVLYAHLGGQPALNAYPDLEF